MGLCMSDDAVFIMLCLIGKWYGWSPNALKMCQFLCIFGHRWVSSVAPTQKTIFVFDWKMVLVSMGGVPMSGNVSIFVYFGHHWGFKSCTNSKNHICVCHVVFDWKMVLVFVGGAPMSSDMSKCVNFSVFLDITGVSSVAPSQKYHICVYHVVFVWKMVFPTGMYHECHHSQ